MCIFAETISMFGNLGNMGMLQEIKQAMDEMKERVEALQVTGASPEEKVKVTINGSKREVLDVSVNPDCITELDAEELEDHIFYALKEAFKAADEANAKEGEALKAKMPNIPGLSSMFGK